MFKLIFTNNLFAIYLPSIRIHLYYTAGISTRQE